MTVDFFVVGAARSGTTSIYNYLSKHPKIFLPKVKECNYFSDVESMDDEVYNLPEPDKQYHMKIIKSKKVYDSLFHSATNEQLKGEVSPSYLWDKNVAKKIYNYNPKAKIIISLRNPIKRAYSHYLMHYNTGYEKKKTFNSAIKDKKMDIWGGGNMYLEMSDYYEQVKAYFDVFDKKNIKIIIYEDWISNIEDTMNNIYEFLNLEAFNDYNFIEKHNKSINIKNRGLLNFFRKRKIKLVLNKLISEELKNKFKYKYFSGNGKIKDLKYTDEKPLKTYFLKNVLKLQTLVKMDLVTKWDLNHD